MRKTLALLMNIVPSRMLLAGDNIERVCIPDKPLHRLCHYMWPAIIYIQEINEKGRTILMQIDIMLNIPPVLAELDVGKNRQHLLGTTLRCTLLCFSTVYCDTFAVPHDHVIGHLACPFSARAWANHVIRTCPCVAISGTDSLTHSLTHARSPDTLWAINAISFKEGAGCGNIQADIRISMSRDKNVFNGTPFYLLGTLASTHHTRKHSQLGYYGHL